MDQTCDVPAPMTPAPTPSPITRHVTINASTYGAANRLDTVVRKRKEPMPAPHPEDAPPFQSQPCVRKLHDQAPELISSSPSAEPNSAPQLQPHVLHDQATKPMSSSPSIELRSSPQLQPHVTCHVHKSRAVRAPRDTPAVTATTSAAPPSPTNGGQRGMLALTSLEMFELFLSGGITEPVALHLFSGDPDKADGFAAILKASRVPCLEMEQHRCGWLAPMDAKPVGMRVAMAGKDLLFCVE